MAIIMDKLKVINKGNNKNMGKVFIIVEMVLYIKVFIQLYLGLWYENYRHIKGFFKYADGTFY
jgi:hypothetical protein